MSPSSRPELAALYARPFAHRGLHGDGRVENSLSAFEAALAAGHGMECDVQLSRDGVAFVFHDETLDRLTDETGPVADRTAEALDQIPLKGSTDRIPRLSELLARIGGAQALLIEIKAPSRRIAALCEAVTRDLARYAGPVAVMSFNPLVGRWFSRHAPDVLRGLVVTEHGKGEARGAISRWLAQWQASPQFLAYDIRDLPSPFAAKARSRGLPVFTWTVRTDAQRETAGRYTDQIIYEHP